jgi:MFS family permease
VSPPLTEQQRTLLLVAAALQVLLTAFDQSAVGPLLPLAIGQLGGMPAYAWAFSAYYLASTVVSPTAGKLGDRHGRRGLLLLGAALTAAAGLLAASAQHIEVFIAARAVQGMAAGIVTTSAFALVGDMLPPAQRGRVAGLLTAVFALAGVLGPLVGGAISDRLSWRAVFVLELPLALCAGLALLRLMPRTAAPQRSAPRPPFDRAGALVLGAMLIALALAGSSPTAMTVQVGSPLAWLAATVVLLLIFCAIERRAADPVVPLRLFREPAVVLGLILSLLTGVGQYAGPVFVPLFLQKSVGSSATEAGVAVLPLICGIVGGNILSGWCMARYRRYKWLAVAGLALASIGQLQLAVLPATRAALWLAMAGMGTAGLGLGLALSALGLAVQNAAPDRLVGVTTGLPQVARTLGGTLGLTALGALLFKRSHLGLPAAVGSVFLVSSAVMAAASGLALFLRDRALRTSSDPEPGV